MAAGDIAQSDASRPQTDYPRVTETLGQSGVSAASGKWQNTWPRERSPQRRGGNPIRATLATQQAISLAKVSELQKQLAILEQKLKELHAQSGFNEASDTDQLGYEYAQESPIANEGCLQPASPVPSFYCITQGVNDVQAANEGSLVNNGSLEGASQVRFVPMKAERVAANVASTSQSRPKRPGWAHRVMCEPTGYENPLSENMDILSSSTGRQNLSSHIDKLCNGDQLMTGDADVECGNSSLYSWTTNQASTCNSNMGNGYPTCSSDATPQPFSYFHSPELAPYPITITSTDFSQGIEEDIWELDTCDLHSESKDTSSQSSIESLGIRFTPMSASSPRPQVNGATKRVSGNMVHGYLPEVKGDTHNTLSVENWSMDANSDVRGDASFLSSSSGLSGDYSMKTSHCNSHVSSGDGAGTSVGNAPLRRSTSSSGSVNRARSVTPLLKRRKKSPMNISVSQQENMSDIDVAPPLSSPRSDGRKSPHQMLKSALKSTAKAMQKTPKPKGRHSLSCKVIKKM